MQNFDEKLNVVEKILESIRGYLWSKWCQKKIRGNRKKNSSKKFLGK